jgi:hypothetical protein
MHLIKLTNWSFTPTNGDGEFIWVNPESISTIRTKRLIPSETWVTEVNMNKSNQNIITVKETPEQINDMINPPTKKK